MADRLASDGWVERGYNYLNLDDCWQAMSRDAAGKLQPDPTRFPSGIQGALPHRLNGAVHSDPVAAGTALADYVHSKGIHLGIYSDYGTQTCMGRPGSYAHERVDAETFAAWGIDMLKMDGCNRPANASYDAGFELMGRELNATGRPILFSCSWPDYIRGSSVEKNVNFTSLAETCNICKRPRYRCHLGCILLRMPAISSLAGRIYNDIQDSWWHVLDIAQWW